MRVLITGGAGFLGYHLAHGLAARGLQPVLLDVAACAPGEYPPGTVAYQGDVRDAGRVQDVLARERPEVVVHAAAALPLWRPEDIRTTNVEGTRTVLEAALAAGVARVVYISSTAVYGVPSKQPMEEADPLAGVGPYGETKVVAERLCQAYRERGLVVPVLRPKTFLGAGRLGVFDLLLDWVQAGKRIPLVGSGRNRYQLLEVQDLVEAIVLVATGPAARVNDVFNVGARVFGTVYEDLAALCRFAGTGARPLPLPAGPVKGALRLCERLGVSPLYRWVYETADKDSVVSTARLEAATGWRPRYSNAEALIHAYRWYRDHGRAHARTGVTHRVGWDPGVLGLVKRLL